jgi:hypothetical protein
MIRKLLCLSPLLAGVLCAQNWEVGALGGYGFSNDLTIKSASGTATAKLAPGAALGVFGGEDTYNYFSGEARYLYRFSDLRLSSAGTIVDFGAHTQIAEGVFLFHFRPRQSRIRPFLAAGGGISVLSGTGRQSAGQPLGHFAALNATREALPTADVGVGVKINLQKHLRLRLEADDYLSATPGKVIAPAPGATLGGVMHNVIAFAALSFTF